MRADSEGMERLGLQPDSLISVRVSKCGFDVFTRDDGLWGQGSDGFYDQRRSPYNQYLNSKGYEGENPWHDFANSGVDENGDMASGWFMKHADKPANIAEEASETPWLTREVIRFMESRKDGAAAEPWMCHASYIKPHWPYIVPEPYHNSMVAIMSRRLCATLLSGMTRIRSMPVHGQCDWQGVPARRSARLGNSCLYGADQTM